MALQPKHASESSAPRGALRGGHHDEIAYAPLAKVFGDTVLERTHSGRHRTRQPYVPPSVAVRVEKGPSLLVGDGPVSIGLLLALWPSYVRVTVPPYSVEALRRTNAYLKKAPLAALLR